MTDEKHLEILRSGVETWNQWREDNPVIEPDLIGAPLIGANLSNTNLARAELDHTDLRNVTISIRLAITSQ